MSLFWMKESSTCLQTSKSKEVSSGIFSSRGHWTLISERGDCGELPGPGAGDMTQKRSSRKEKGGGAFSGATRRWGASNEALCQERRECHRLKVATPL